MVLMIICVCNAINCKSVRAAVEAGADNPKAVQAHHGCKFQCGKCRSSIGEMIAETDMDRGPAPALMAAE
ncbi:bacterioferritin-associated ferredoxin [Hyphomonas sp.]|uniref:(2Fe-2S)-binding protein n=1 Tax=Hyphomonas sp. TaxID=87 RepID=UPI0035281AA5